MIKTICFDLGNDKEIHLTMEEVRKLAQAFRYIEHDNYKPAAGLHKPIGLRQFIQGEDLEKAKQEIQNQFNNAKGLYER